MVYGERHLAKSTYLLVQSCTLQGGRSASPGWYLNNGHVICLRFPVRCFAAREITYTSGIAHPSAAECAVLLHVINIFVKIKLKSIKFLLSYTVVTSEALSVLCVNDLPRVAARQCGGWDSDPLPLDRKSSSLTLHTLPSHTCTCATVHEVLTAQLSIAFRTKERTEME